MDEYHISFHLMYYIEQSKKLIFLFYILLNVIIYFNNLDVLFIQ